jgi:hypothetical protein
VKTTGKKNAKVAMTAVPYQHNPSWHNHLLPPRGYEPPVGPIAKQRIGWKNRTEKTHPTGASNNTLFAEREAMSATVVGKILVTP